MKKNTKKILIIISVVMLVLIVGYFGIRLMTIYDQGYEDVSMPICNVETQQCTNSVPIDSSVRIVNKWVIYDDWREFSSNPNFNAFFYRDWNIESVKTHEYYTDGTNYFKDMYPQRCTNMSLDAVQQYLASQYSINTFGGAGPSPDYSFDCVYYSLTAPFVKDVTITNQQLNSNECFDITYSYKIASVKSGTQYCNKRELFNDYSCNCKLGSGSFPNNIIYDTKTITIDETYSSFNIEDLMSNNKTAFNIAQYGKLGLFSPSYKSCHNSPVTWCSTMSISELNSWTTDFFSNKLCWVEIIDDSNALVKVYGKTYYSSNQLSCMLEETNPYGSINGYLATPSELSNDIKNGEKQFANDRVDVNWDFSTSTFPTIPTQQIQNNTQPTEQTQPTNPTEPTNPTNPTQPVTPENPNNHLATYIIVSVFAIAIIVLLITILTKFTKKRR